MVRLSQERVLLIGDVDRQMYSAVMQALPTAQVRSVANLFDGIAEMTSEQYTTVLASAEPIERRPEAAVKTLRELAGDGRLLLFGHPTLEPLSQKMLEFGCDDYLVTPATPAELLELLGSASLRLRHARGDRKNENAASTAPTELLADHISPLSRIPVADIALECLLQSPQETESAVIKQINTLLPPTMNIASALPGSAMPAAAPGTIVATHLPEQTTGSYAQALHLTMPADADRNAAQSFLAELARHLGRVHLLQERHASLQRLAITDDLTTLSNGRYFRHFLTKIIEKARVMRFPVTLFLFDIDNFKRYNDQYGHGVGDDILKQTAALMRKCVRDHDLVARISGDEFAVVFWEKEGPRQPRDPKNLATARTPQEPHEILDRFRRSLSTENFPGLGAGGKGSLTISGGLAVFPWNAQDANGLIDAADKELMFGAKRGGRNSIQLVGGQCLPLGCELPEEASGNPEV
ncbi:MAG: GGDEF domain-containing protein [Planctomycetota bacterium]|nr:GGDEF domain-containing protein [Planctomycetota bacterium]